MTYPITIRVANRYVCREAAFQVCRLQTFRSRSAALQDVTPAVLSVFAEALIPEGKVAFFGAVVKKLKKLLALIKKAPTLWTKIKEMLGKDITLAGLPKAIKEWLKKGKDVLKKLFSKVTQKFPLALYFVPSIKMPGLTDALQRIVERSPTLRKILAGIKDIAGRVDQWLDKYLPTLQRPLLAAIFAFVWFNVAELSWDIPGLVKGFTGGISFGELLASLPESGIGLFAAMSGLGFGALPVTILARLLWLAGKRLIEWARGSIKIRWDKIDPDTPIAVEEVPVF